MKRGNLMEQLKAYGDEEEIEIEIYETVSGASAVWRNHLDRRN